jgi:uncharacterized DUF497 family protein
MTPRRWIPIATLFILIASLASGQGSFLTSTEVSPFMGTWTFAMTEPRNSEQTVKVWDNDGKAAASLQIGKFPPNEATGIFKDGDVLIVTTSVRENGEPRWAVVALKREGDTMVMSQMIQKSSVVKRGTAVKALSGTSF